ncbi:MAG: hypothetical protein K2Q45_06530 [Nitrosomonas sp.]|nr:hypothetical protein [Nitrosomonas sp.]
MKSSVATVSGIVCAWSVPERDSSNLFASVVSILQDDDSFFFLTVMLEAVEDHLWSTGERVLVHHVLCKSAAHGTTYKSIRPLSEDDEPRYPFFFNTAALVIEAFFREEHFVVWFTNGSFALCEDKKKELQLLQLGAGKTVLLFNVKATAQGPILTIDSGIRETAPIPLSPPVMLEPRIVETVWKCIVCSVWNNYKFNRCCKACNSDRKEGPAYKNDKFYATKKKYGQSYKRGTRPEPWYCNRKGCKKANEYYVYECAYCQQKKPAFEYMPMKQKKNLGFLPSP